MRLSYLFLISLFTFINSSTLFAEETINKNTPYQAELVSDDNSLQVNLTSKSGSKEVISIPYDTDLLPIPSRNYRIEDINFDGLDDIAVVNSLGYGGVNIFYSIYLAQGNTYVESKDLYLSNFTVHREFEVVESEFKSGPRHYTQLFQVNNGRLQSYVVYENYNSDLDLCYIDSLYGKKAESVDDKLIYSCEVLLNKQQTQPYYAKVVTERAYLYNDIYGNEKSGMYLINNDTVEVLSGSPTGDMIKVRFKGKILVEKYIKLKEVSLLTTTTYLNHHKISWYNNGTTQVDAVADELILTPTPGNQYIFEINTIGNNVHTCDISGIAKVENDTLVYRDGECQLILKPTSQGFKSLDKNNGCKDWCGFNASLDDIEFDKEP